MVEVVNLNHARKKRAKGAAKVKAAENRAAFGRTKVERDLEKARSQLTRRELDAHKRDA